MTAFFHGTVILAPMCDYTSRPFRRLCREHGADVVVTEMLAADALAHRGKRTLDMLRFDEVERPIGAQLHGHRPELMAAAAGIAAEAGVDFIDINAGCPQRKVVNSGNGAALLRDLPLLEQLVRAVRAAVRVPLSLKVRVGWDAQSNVVAEVGRMAEACGCDAIVLHARTRAQLFGGRADWREIARLKAAVRIPVIGNGDVASRADALRMRAETGCDAVMVGRAAIGNPWVFEAIQGRRTTPPSAHEIRAVVERHFALQCEDTNARHAALTMRKHLVGYTRGLPGATHLRRSLSSIVDDQTFQAAVSAYFDALSDDETPAEPGFAPAEPVALLDAAS